MAKLPEAGEGIGSVVTEAEKSPLYINYLSLNEDALGFGDLRVRADIPADQLKGAIWISMDDIGAPRAAAAAEPRKTAANPVPTTGPINTTGNSFTADDNPPPPTQKGPATQPEPPVDRGLRHKSEEEKIKNTVINILAAAYRAASKSGKKKERAARLDAFEKLIEYMTQSISRDAAEEATLYTAAFKRLDEILANSTKEISRIVSIDHNGEKIQEIDGWQALKLLKNAVKLYYAAEKSPAEPATARVPVLINAALNSKSDDEFRRILLSSKSNLESMRWNRDVLRDTARKASGPDAREQHKKAVLAIRETRNAKHAFAEVFTVAGSAKVTFGLNNVKRIQAIAANAQKNPNTILDIDNEELEKLAPTLRKMVRAAARKRHGKAANPA